MSTGGPLSVVVPTLNEAATLPALFDALHAQRDISLDCVIADGGSVDGTLTLAISRGARAVRSAAGRGRQLNAGAAAARARWLLFLHADSRFTAPTQLADALRALERARAGAAGGPLAGHFALRFDRRQPGYDRLFAFLEAKTASNRPYSVNGDQGLLIHRDDFDALGGYDESLPIFEDQRIAARIFERGRWLLLPHRLITSARRFETEGHVPRYALMALMMAMAHADMPEFFVEARGLYAAQHEAAPLRLAPYRALALRLLRAHGWPGTARATLGCGRLLRDNIWQLALLRDLERADGLDTAQRRHDRWVAPLLKLPGTTAVAGTAALMFLLLGLPLFERNHRGGVEAAGDARP